MLIFAHDAIRHGAETYLIYSMFLYILNKSFHIIDTSLVLSKVKKCHELATKRQSSTALPWAKRQP